MDINIDPSCDWTMDSDMVLGSSPGPDVTMAPVAGRSLRLAWTQQPSGPRIPIWSQILRITLPAIARGALGISTDSGCGRVMDPDLALAIAHACTIHWPWVAVHVTLARQQYGSQAPRSGGRDPGHQFGLQWQHGPWTSAQTQAAVGPWAQTWSSATAWACMSLWP